MIDYVYDYANGSNFGLSDGGGGARVPKSSRSANRSSVFEGCWGLLRLRFFIGIGDGARGGICVAEIGVGINCGGAADEVAIGWEKKSNGSVW